jgi:hypothetical protein
VTGKLWSCEIIKDSKFVSLYSTKVVKCQVTVKREITLFIICWKAISGLTMKHLPHGNNECLKLFNTRGCQMPSYTRERDTSIHTFFNVFRTLKSLVCPILCWKAINGLTMKHLPHGNNE